MKLNILGNHSLKPYNSFHVECIPDAFINIENVKAVIEANQWHKNHISQKPILVLGGGTNIVFKEKVYNGLVLCNNIKGRSIVFEDDKHVIVQVGAGEHWNDFVQYCVKNLWYGIENLTSIPGTCGAAPVQNIGAYGSEVKDTIYEVSFYNFDKEKLLVFSNEDCQFSYRNSIFKQDLKGKGYITNVTFKLNKAKYINLNYKDLKTYFSNRNVSEVSIQEVSDAVKEIRENKLPNSKKNGNGGSFFKNPIISKIDFEALSKLYDSIPHFVLDRKDNIKIPAAWLIEQIGFKGRQLGNVACDDKQPLVIKNIGGASGKEIIDFSKIIQNKVYEKFGIKLEPEVSFV